MRKKHYIVFVLHFGESKVCHCIEIIKNVSTFYLIFFVCEVPCGNSFFKNNEDGKHLFVVLYEALRVF